MRKIGLLLLFIVAFNCKPVQAFDVFSYQGFNVLVPGADIFGGVFYDVVGKEILGAVETPILSYDRLDNVFLTMGVAGDLSNENTGELRERSRELLGSGTPYIGLNVHVPIIGDKFFISSGAGYNTKEGKMLAGFASSYKFW